MRPALILLLSIFLLSSCNRANRWAEEIGWEMLDFDSLPGEEDYPDAAAIILHDKGVVDVVGGGDTGYTYYERHRIIKVLNAAGYRYANISIPYGSSSRIESIKARTISPDGTITVLDPETIYDVNLYPNFIFYSDQRSKIFTMPAVSKGSVIEYRYAMIIKGWTVVSSWSFQDFIPTLHSEFKVIVPSSWEMNYKMYGIPLEPDIYSTPQGFKSTYTWTTSELPPLTNEFAMPPQREIGARLDIAPIGVESWQDVSQWYAGLCENRMKAGDEIKELVREITAGLESDMDKMRAIFEWIREEIRYIAVAIGIGGYQPHHASEIFLNRYGDCKDMSTLLVSMAKEAGIEAYQVLISTKQNGVPDTSMASPYHFNHIIAYAPALGDSGLWMDATEKGTPFGSIPWYNQGLPVLIVKDDGSGEVAFTPEVPASHNHMILEWKAQLGRKGQAFVNGKTVYGGAYAGELREGLMFTGSTDRRQWLDQQVARYASGAELDSFSFSGLLPGDDPLMVEYSFTTKSLASRHGDEMIIRPAGFFRMDLPDYFHGKARDNPVRFRYGMMRSFRLQIELPPNWELKTPDRVDSLKSEFGEALWYWKMTGDILNIAMEYRLPGKDISADHYKAFRKFLDDVRMSQIRDLVVQKKAVSLP